VTREMPDQQANLESTPRLDHQARRDHQDHLENLDPLDHREIPEHQPSMSRCAQESPEKQETPDLKDHQDRPEMPAKMANQARQARKDQRDRPDQLAPTANPAHKDHQARPATRERRVFARNTVPWTAVCSSRMEQDDRRHCAQLCIQTVCNIHPPPLFPAIVANKTRLSCITKTMR
jgi:hypothetical protein